MTLFYMGIIEELIQLWKVERYINHSSDGKIKYYVHESFDINVEEVKFGNAGIILHLKFEILKSKVSVFWRVSNHRAQQVTLGICKGL